MEIWKYELEVTDTQEIPMPAGALLLSVAEQGGSLCLWVNVDPELPTTERTIRIFGTGHVIPDEEGLLYLGTAQQKRAGFVWHVFEQFGAKGKTP